MAPEPRTAGRPPASCDGLRRTAQDCWPAGARPQTGNVAEHSSLQHRDNAREDRFRNARPPRLCNRMSFSGSNGATQKPPRARRERPGAPSLWLHAARACALYGALFCGAVQASGLASLPLESCQLSSAAAHAAAAARCGRLAVPENRDEPGGKILRLHVAVIPALRLQPEPDPLFVLSGGPGQAASDFYLSVAPAFARVRRDRDIVLVDQRGVGRSNRLDCALPDSGELAHVDLGRLDAAVQSCLAALPSDPRFYSTSIAVRDLDEVRAALGYERVNVYGVSYGTRVAQHYMRRYPQRVRAAILD